MKRAFAWLLPLIIILLAAGCSSASNDDKPPANKHIIAYEDVIRSLKKLKLQPKERSEDFNLILKEVKPKTLELNNGNIMVISVYDSSDSAVKAHREYNEKSALFDYVLAPRTNPVKNLFVIYFDNQYYDFMQSL
ncbi:hypothetical protein [Paenibacillus piscarius]|uniref:hypothetical protein n=1 Tax=Paenibacillus piscarius TaxID=1089681 RepID=UPI001EE99FC4|nr:hypothetical protein [Paenibacillus piscarius]